MEHGPGPVEIEFNDFVAKFDQRLDEIDVPDPGPGELRGVGG